MQVETVDGPETESRPPRRPTVSLLVQVFGGFVLTLFWAALCTVVIDFWQSGGSLSRVFGYEIFGPMRLILLVSAGIVWAVLALLIAVTNRLFLSCGVLLAAATVIGLADYQKLQLRREPIYPSDLSFLNQTGFLSAMVDTRNLVGGALAAMLVVLVAVILGRIAGRRYPHPRRRTERRFWRVWTVGRVVVGLGALAFLLSLQSFNEPGNPVKRTYEKAGAHWAFWFQEVNYYRHGFVAGFLYNMPVPAMLEPSGYSRATMDDIARRYAQPSSPVAAPTHGVGSDDLNVVVVLSEAFSDPRRIEGATLDEDPIPRTRALMGQTTSGNMLAQLFGGGTANMEFEALTGQSLSQFLPQMNTPYQMLVTTQDSYPSVVGYLRREGSGALAVHPYMTTMYKRYAVYPELGFQEFVHDSTMAEDDRIDDGAFISDESAYDEVLRQLDEAEDPTLVNLVTMQNHFPNKDQYDDPFEVSGVSGDEKEELAHYARGIKHTDDATHDFLTSLEESDEPTAVVFFGDHLPAIWGEKTREKNDPLTLRQTPYFLWTNFEQLPARSEEVTSPIYFLPMLWRELGLELPAYYNLLLALHEQIPAMEQGEYYLPDGRMVAEEDLPPEAKAVLEDYRMVQYDFSIGKRYAVDAMFPQAD